MKLQQRKEEFRKKQESIDDFEGCVEATTAKKKTAKKRNYGET